jgi:hypothetical protein
MEVFSWDVPALRIQIGDNRGYQRDFDSSIPIRTIGPLAFALQSNFAGVGLGGLG